MIDSLASRSSRIVVVMAACFLTAGALTACSGDDTGGGSSDGSSSTTAEEISVLDGTYTSTTVTGRVLAAGTTITLEFSGVQLTYDAGCNTMSGNYTIESNVLTVESDVTSTEKDCEQDLMDQDEWLTGLLTSGMTVSNAEGSELTLSSGDVTITFVQGDTAEGDDLSGQPNGPNS